MEPNPSGAPFVLVEGEGFEPSKAEPSDLQSDPFGRSGTPPNETSNCEGIALISQCAFLAVLRVHDLSGSVARHLSGRHSAPKGVPNETNGSATGEPKDEIRRNV